MNIGNRNLERFCISECAFLDYIVIILRGEDDLKRNLNVWNGGAIE